LAWDFIKHSSAQTLKGGGHEVCAGRKLIPKGGARLWADPNGLGAGWALILATSKWKKKRLEECVEEVSEFSEKLGHQFREKGEGKENGSRRLVVLEKITTTFIQRDGEDG